MFFELILKKLLKYNGKMGAITPRFFLVNKINKEFRKFILKEIDLLEIVETSPFEEAQTECLISIISNTKPNNNFILVNEDFNGKIKLINKISKDYSLKNENYEIQSFLTENKIKIFEKMEIKSLKLLDISQSKRGMEIGKNNFEKIGIKSLVGYDVKKYYIEFDEKYISEINNQYSRLKEFFENKLVFLRRVSSDLIATISINDEKYAYNKNLYGIKLLNKNMNEKYLLVLLNSKILNFYYKNKFSMKKIDLYPEIQSYLFLQLPIKQISLEEQTPFIEKANLMLELHKNFNNLKEKFTKNIQREFNLEKISKKLNDWYLLEYKDFLKEIEKNKIKLSLAQKAEWEEYFEIEKKKIIEIKNKISQTDKIIDKMVYELYNLTDEEIRIVEEN